MSVQWYAKLEAGFHSNRKARKAKMLGRAVFVFVLTANAGRGGTGWIPASDLELWYLADELQVSEDDAQEGVDLAVAANLIAIHDGRVEIVGWTNEYSKRPMTDGERQQKRRSVTRHESKRDSSRNVTHGHDDRDASRREVGRKEGRETGSLSGLSNVTGHETFVTGHDESVTGGERSSQEHDSDGGSEQRGISAGRNTRRTREAVAPEWLPSADVIQLARELGLDVEHEARQFRLHAKSNGRKYDDVDAAFEKFVRQSRDAGKGKRASKPGAVTAAPQQYFVVMNGTRWEVDADGEPIRRVGPEHDAALQPIKLRSGSEPKEKTT